VDPEFHPVANAHVHIGMLDMTGSRDGNTGPMDISHFGAARRNAAGDCIS